MSIIARRLSPSGRVKTLFLREGRRKEGIEQDGVTSGGSKIQPDRLIYSRVCLQGNDFASFVGHFCKFGIGRLGRSHPRLRSEE
jgi:hypothetical protein